MQKRLPLSVGTIVEGRYRIVRKLRAGAMGAVYEATDTRLKNRVVALKETFADNDETRQAFKREAELLANIEHEAFPKVTDYFTQDDGCFLVMELIRGDDLDELLAKRAAPFEPEQVLTWADQILDALEDLHANSIIHRDIKPSNLKLTPKGKIKLLDFGIAKGNLEGDTTLLPGMGSIAAATLRFAPLEQILKANPDWYDALSVSYPQQTADILQRGTDARSDLYALAATLYQLLTNHLPVNAPTRALALWVGEPDKLRPAYEVNTQVSKEVSDILQKAMKIDRRERPSSAAEMRRMLKEAGKPIGEETFASTFNPFVEPATKDTPQHFKVIPIKPVTTDEALRSLDLPEPADKSKTSLLLYAGLIALPVLLVIIGWAAYLALSHKTSNPASNKPVSDMSQKTLTGHSNYVNSVAFSPDGKTIVSGGNDKTIKLWDVASGNLKHTLIGHSDEVKSVAFSPDGKTIASAGGDATASGNSTLTIKLWDVASGNLKQTLIGTVNSVAFSPDGKAIVGGGHRDIYLYNAANGTIKQTLTGHADWVNSVAFSPDGKTIVSGGDEDQTIKLWDAASGALKRTLAGHSGRVISVAFSPDSKTIASGSHDKTIKLWDAARGALKQTIIGDRSGVIEVVFSPDGKTIASGGSDFTIKLWDVASGNLKQTLTGHHDSVMSIAFSPDGKTIVSGSTYGDPTIKLWRVE